MNLYTILVPTIRNDGRPIHLRFHKVWDEKVRAISKGLTILHPSKGHWIDSEGKVYIERMIPVQISCTKEQIIQIARMTVKYYEQKVIMCYKVSDEVFFIKNECSEHLA